MTHRKIAPMAALLLATFAAELHAGENERGAAGIERVRLHVAGIV